jgi:hypothetical protein
MPDLDKERRWWRFKGRRRNPRRGAFFRIPNLPKEISPSIISVVVTFITFTREPPFFS